MRRPAPSPTPRAGTIAANARAPRWPRAALAAIVAGGLLAPGWTRADEPAALVMSDSAHDVILEVSVNGENTALLAHFRERDGHLSASGADLRTIGFATGRLGIADSATVDLDTIPGLRYRYDAARQSVDLQMPDALRRPYAVDSRALPATQAATASRGIAINYEAYAQTIGDRQFSLYTDVRYFDPNGVFDTTGTAYFYNGHRRYTRFDTSWSRSDPARPSTTQIGDTISGSLPWTRSVRLGGFQWRSNFALRPDLVTFPIPSLSGSAAVPTAVDLYINNVRQYTGNVPSGPFIIHDVPGITGAGQATVITRDALGRTVATSVPLYVDTRMLSAGLSSYSFETGFLRRNYGLESFDYDARPAVSGSMRRGLSDTLTVEGHAEATGGVLNAGVGALMRLGYAGVMNGAVAGSVGRFSGTQVSVGYQLIEPRFSINAQTIRAFGRYGDLASRDGSPVPSATDQATLALPFLHRQTLSLSYIGFRLPQGPSARIGTVSYTLSFGDLASLSVSAYRDFAQQGANGAFVSLNIGLGRNTSINATVGRQRGQSNYSVDASRPPDYDGGWGWGVQTGGTGAVPYRQAQLRYLGRAGEVIAAAQGIDRQTGASLDVSGALVFMDRSLQLSRRIDDGFVLVSTDGVAGIPVLHENRVIGTTDRAGHLLVPDLNAYQNNQVAIDSMKLPADARIARTSMTIVPQAQSGVVAHFGVSRYRAASVILRDAAGQPLPAGARVHHAESGADTIVGYDGLTFVDGLKEDNHLVIDYGTQRCVAEFAFTAPGNGTLPTVGPLTCRPAP
ncbi:fimbria/pilus outer membrane usher protein [Burkholderia stabilis]|uniref:F1 capsule-anchoring protein,fimbrial outer membrane usher protein PefC,Fimbrial Usher protein n=1 Tax=Burkholderia stabilis TaxID=95485 RepID=A0AAJ5T318_9BURK|nr:fimbria/pilus outer membrane usher protein [Burkholderia stabilis]VBB11052.1 F1 capsule-anchoring protein precursor,fimbrial outer membrane usher protein PefC,Fimbrial Usher protein [Burkholderia stabilis]